MMNQCTALKENGSWLSSELILILHHDGDVVVDNPCLSDNGMGTTQCRNLKGSR